MSVIERDTREEKEMELEISGHTVTLNFSENCLPRAAEFVRNCLIDSYIRQHNLRVPTNCAGAEERQ